MFCCPPGRLALLGLMAIGSFLNVVVHTALPLLLERQWWSDVAAQLCKTLIPTSRVFGTDARPDRPRAGTQAASLEKALGRRSPASALSRPASRCPARAVTRFAGTKTYRWSAGWCCAASVLHASRAHRPGATPLVEVGHGTAVLRPRCAPHRRPNLHVLLWCAVAAVLLALSLIDWDTTVLPDAHDPAACSGPGSVCGSAGLAARR